MIGAKCSQLRLLGYASENYQRLSKMPIPSKRSSSNAAMKQQMRHQSKSIGLPGFGLLIIPVATFCLGTWQVKRRKWKLNLIENLNQQLHHPPIEIPEDLEELNKLDYRKVILRGTFEHKKELFVIPRTLTNNEENSSRGLISNSSQNGSHVVTPFKLADRNETILINRGWIPRNKIKPESRLEGQVEGEVELVGIYRKSEGRAPFMPKNDKHSSFWHWRDVYGMAEKLNAEPFMFDVTAGSTIPGGPIGGQTRVTLRNEHFSYIVTWYSLSFLTSLLWYRRYIKQLPLM